MTWTEDRKPLYSLDEVATLFGVCRETIRLRSKQAGLKRRIVQRVRYYSEEDLKQMCGLPLRGKAKEGGV